LVGYTGLGTVKTKIKDVDALIELPFQDSEWVEDGETGIYIPNTMGSPEEEGWFRAYINDLDVQSICGDYQKQISASYDIFLYTPSGEAALQLYGVATLIPANTRIG
jgi:hypothetical protein